MIVINSMKALLKYMLLVFLAAFISCGDTTEKNTDSKSPDITTAGENTETGRTILFFGNSLTAGMGLDPREAFPALIQQKIDSLGLDYTVVNAGLSGETTASGLNRLPWVLNQRVSIFVLELGANDGLRGIPVAETRKNLLAIIEGVKQENPEVDIVLAGMQIPPNMGNTYAGNFRKLFPDLAAEKELSLIPFLLEDVGGVPELNQADGIHPTARGHQIIADNIWPVLYEVIQQQQQEASIQSLEPVAE